MGKINVNTRSFEARATATPINENFANGSVCPLYADSVFESLKAHVNIVVFFDNSLQKRIQI